MALPFEEIVGTGQDKQMDGQTTDRVQRFMRPPIGRVA